MTTVFIELPRPRHHRLEQETGILMQCASSGRGHRWQGERIVEVSADGIQVAMSGRGATRRASSRWLRTSTSWQLPASFRREHDRRQRIGRSGHYRRRGRQASRSPPAAACPARPWRPGSRAGRAASNSWVPGCRAPGRSSGLPSLLTASRRHTTIACWWHRCH